MISDTTTADAEAGAGGAMPASFMGGARFVVYPAALAAIVLGFVLLPRVHGNPHLTNAFLLAGAALLVFAAIVASRVRATKRVLEIGFATVKAHYIQAAVQFTIYCWWGWHFRDVYAQAPLIVAQLVYVYALDGLIAFARGRPWRIGFGPLPVIFSTNLLLWFRDDWFALQFAMVTAGVLGKEFIRWRRDGRTTHIFNPSVFGQSLMACVLIATGMTSAATRGEDIAASFERVPHILLLLFGLGLIVQYHFSVTLMTLAAASALCLVNIVYTQVTGVYFFTTMNIGATIFLGLHLLVTDPATSPRSNVGRIVFGALYGLGYCALFQILHDFGVPLFWDKLLPVPILNLLVPAIDRFAHFGIVGRIESGWNRLLPARKLNLAHMGVWIALFTTLVATDFVEGKHEGRTLGFWRKAYEDGKHRADERLLEFTMHGARRGSGEALNMLGKLHLEGKLVAHDEAAAAHFFAQSCRAGYLVGCENVLGGFFFSRRAESPEDVKIALDELEPMCEKAGAGLPCLYVGMAYELGVHRERDEERALELFERGCREGRLECCEALARLMARRGPQDSPEAAQRDANRRALLDEARRRLSRERESAADGAGGGDGTR